MILVFCRSVISFPGLRFTASSKALQLGSAGWPLDSGQKAETTVTRFPDLEAASGGTLLGPLLLPPWCPKGHSLTPRHGLCSLAGAKRGTNDARFFHHCNRRHHGGGRTWRLLLASPAGGADATSQIGEQPISPFRCSQPRHPAGASFLETSDLPNVQASGAVRGEGRASVLPKARKLGVSAQVCRASFRNLR